MRWLLLLIGLLLVACASPAPPQTAPSPAPLAAATVPPPTPTSAPMPSPTPPPLAADDSAAVATAQAQGLARDPLELALLWGRVSAPLTPPPPPSPQPGETIAFWATDFRTERAIVITATLRAQSQHLLLYVEDGQPYDEAALAEATRIFEAETWPLMTAWFPPEALPRGPVTVLNARLHGVGGYYTAAAEYPQAINRYSNEREMIYINTENVAPPGIAYQAVLAHELQHLIHNNALLDPATWFNEGASMLAEHRLGGNDQYLARAFLETPDTQLNGWSTDGPTTLRHYGAAQLWLRYADARLPAGIALGDLALNDAGDDLALFVAALSPALPDIAELGDLYATWAVANLLNDSSIADGRYAYPDLPRTVEPLAAQPQEEATVAQLGSDYLRLAPSPEARTISWTGALTVALAPVPSDGATPLWWAGSGDGRVSTLSAEIAVPTAGDTLRFERWFELEEAYDYAYLSLSEDGGASWRPLATTASTQSNPVGQNLGQGWNGDGRAWADEEIDLGPWAGQTIILRFWQITDDAYHGAGVFVRNLTLASGTQAPWSGQGWVQVRNQLPQTWELRGVLWPAEGPPQVYEIPVSDGKAEWIVPANTQADLIISATQPATSERAAYRYAVAP